MVRLSSTGEAVGAVERARDVRACAYTMHGAMLRALESAAKGGAHVVVRLDDLTGEPSLRELNERAVRALRAAGAEAKLQPGMHEKAVFADGVAFYDSRNWNAGDFVVSTSEDVVARKKQDALSLEASMLDGATAGDRVLLESETFGTGNPVFGALGRLGRAGAHPRLMVSSRVLHGNRREASLLRHLTGHGVEVRVCNDSEKFALAGNAAWVGSANASYDKRDANLIDWGLATRDSTIVDAARARLEARWQTAKPFRLR